LQGAVQVNVEKNDHRSPAHTPKSAQGVSKHEIHTPTPCRTCPK
jgi:hypothetical protein